MIKFKLFNLLESFETNTYLVYDEESKEAILIDPAAPSEQLKLFIEDMQLNLVHIFNTHGHGDHIGGNEYFHKIFNAPIGIHDFDSQMLIDSALNMSDFMYTPIISPTASLLMRERYNFTLGDNAVEIIHTPGHTRGGMVIYCKPYLFSGDTLFNQSVGRTDLPGGDSRQLIESIKKKIYVLPDETIVFPGHGPSTTIGAEKKDNPFVL